MIEYDEILEFTGDENGFTITMQTLFKLKKWLSLERSSTEEPRFWG